MRLAEVSNVTASASGEHEAAADWRQACVGERNSARTLLRKVRFATVRALLYARSWSHPAVHAHVDD